MSPEVCPFCGKTYKRLKSHLPHCKVAASSQTLPKDVAAAQKPSCHPAAAAFKTTSKGKKTKLMSSVATDLQLERSKKGSVPRLPVQLATLGDGSSSSSGFASTSSSSRKKETQTLADQIGTKTLSTSPSSPVSSTLSRPKKKSLRALIEAAKSEHIVKEKLKGTGLASEDLSRSRTGKQAEIKNSVVLVSGKVKANEEPKMKDDLPKAKSTSYLLDSNKNKNNPIPPGVREDLSVDGDWVTKEGSVKLGAGRQMRVTLQDVRATLGRATTSRASILSRIAAAEDLSREIGPDGDLRLLPLAAESPKHATNHSASPTTPSDGQPSTETQQRELQLFQKSEPPQRVADGPPETASADASVQRGRSTLSLNESPKAEPHRGPPWVSAPLHQFSSHLLSPAGAQSSPGMVEDFQLDVGRKNVAEKPNEGLLTNQSLGQVRLKELPVWLASRTPSHPREVVEMLQRGWLWYYRRYIDVKKGGVGGLSMLLAGYCVLSYIWSYPHIKLSRWRKYH